MSFGKYHHESGSGAEILAELNESKADIRVHAYMTPDVKTITPDASLLEVHRIMGVKRFRTLPVVQAGKLVGIVTRADLLSADPPRLFSKDLWDLKWQIENRKVAQIMTSPVITVRPNDSIVAAARLMLEKKIHSLVVLDADDQIAGVITDTDLLTLIVRKFC